MWLCEEVIRDKYLKRYNDVNSTAQNFKAPNQYVLTDELNTVHAFLQSNMCDIHH